MEQNTNKTEQEPQEATTIGMFLKFTRQNQKKSIETVSKALCIRKIYIKAIEESDFAELPPVPYGVGFVRSYADFLGLNADRIVQCYKEEALPNKNESEAKPIIKKHTSITIPNRKQILISISLILGLYFIILALDSNDKPKIAPVQNNTLIEDVQIEETIPEEVIIAEEPVENEIVTIVEESYEEEPKTSETIQEEPTNKILVKFKGESWFEVKDNNKVYISGIYKEGFEYTLPDVPNLIFSVGRYYNVDVFINGELTKVAGPKKQTNIKIDEFLNH